MNTCFKTGLGLAGATALGLMTVVSCLSSSPSMAVAAPNVPDEIRHEAMLPGIGPEGRPLPLAAHWNSGGSKGTGFSPAWQLEMIAQGHHLLPWFSYSGPPDMSKWSAKQKENYQKGIVDEYESALEQEAKLHLPVVFMTTQWEAVLTHETNYFDLPPDKNPNVVTAEDTILTTLSPFGPVGPWREVGAQWGAETVHPQLEKWYPDPPLVMFLSNNEHSRLTWQKAEEDRRYIARQGRGTDDATKRKWVAQGWEERYRALQGAFRDSFTSPEWKQNTVFTGYNVFGYPHRPIMAGWDGGSPSYYVCDWDNSTDFTVTSPQIQWMGAPGTLAEIYKVDPKFFFELSVWDGNEPDRGGDERRYYAKLGQEFTPERYGGFVQFGMWLLRPRVLREFRGWLDTRARIGAYFDQLVEGVDRVHNNAVLRSFWRTGELVPNRAQPPLQPPDATAPNPDADKWFLLDTNLDPQRPWQANTEIPVFSLALVQGKAPRREWLVYAHAPLGARTDVQVTLPEFGPITIDASQAGSFYLVTEEGKKITAIVRGGPASVRASASTNFPAPGERVTFAASDVYGPDGPLRTFRWDFGDGQSATALKTDHAYEARGIYVAKLTASDGKGTEVTRELPVFVGQETGNGLVLRYPMTRAGKSIVYDASGRGNHGEQIGGQWVNDPVRGPSIELDGKADYIAPYNTSDINTGGPYSNRTISIWFKPNQVKSRQTLYEEGGGGNGMNVYLDKGTVCAGAWASKVWPGTWLASEPISSNQWTHAAMVLRDAGPAASADKLELYLNGKKVASGPASQVPAHVADIGIGRCGNSRFPNGPYDGAGLHFGGCLGEIRVYNRALSPDEIAALAK